VSSELVADFMSDTMLSNFRAVGRSSLHLLGESVLYICNSCASQNEVDGELDNPGDEAKSE
jgi:hypothetical protein